MAVNFSVISLNMPFYRYL